jgi:hypothetical protein
MPSPKPLVAPLAAAALCIIATAAQSEVVQRVVVANAFPPTVTTDPGPAPTERFVWSPGYWSVQDGSLIWSVGMWVDRVPGFVYHQPRTGVRSDGKYFYEAGHYSSLDTLPVLAELRRQ